MAKKNRTRRRKTQKTQTNKTDKELARRTVRLRTPEDVLALVPTTLGFHPSESLVVVTAGATRPFQARVDLPGDAYDTAELAEMTDFIVDVCVRNGLHKAVVVVYSDDDTLALAAYRALRDRADHDGIELPLAIRADGQRWFCLEEPCRAGAGGCPPDGTPYDVTAHALAAQAVLDGKVIQPSREALRDTLVGNDPDEVERVEAAVEAATMRLVGSLRAPLGQPRPDGPTQHLVQEGHWVRHRVRRYLEDREPLDVHDAGRMIAALVSIQVRDVAWAEMSHEDAGAHIELWRDLVRRCPVVYAAAPAALMAFAAWLAGDGALAWCAVERSQEAEPDYGLAALVTQALAGAVPPDTWTPPDESTLTLFAS